MNKISLPTTSKKDVFIIFIFIVVAFSNIILYICENGFSSINELFEQTILIMLAFVGLLEIFHFVGWDIFVPDFMLTNKKQERMNELQHCVEQVVNHSIDELIAQSIDIYFQRNENFIKDYSEETVHYILTQLGITAKQFDQIRVELIKMRCLPLATLNDAQKKLEQYIKCDDPFVIDLSKIDCAKTTYSKVNYYINFNDTMYLPSISRELVSIMRLLICENFDIATFDKIVIPHDSNFILGLEIGKLLEKPVIHMRRTSGRIEREKCWDGKLSPIDKVLIVHDVLVTSDQIVHTIEKLPSSCQIAGLCCLIARKEWNGISILEERYQLQVKRVLDLSDEDIMRRRQS